MKMRLCKEILKVPDSWTPVWSWALSVHAHIESLKRLVEGGSVGRFFFQIVSFLGGELTSSKHQEGSGCKCQQLEADVARLLLLQKDVLLEIQSLRSQVSALERHGISQSFNVGGMEASKKRPWNNLRSCPEVRGNRLQSGWKKPWKLLTKRRFLLCKTKFLRTEVWWQFSAEKKGLDIVGIAPFKPLVLTAARLVLQCSLAQLCRIAEECRRRAVFFQVGEAPGETGRCSEPRVTQRFLRLKSDLKLANVPP